MAEPGVRLPNLDMRTSACSAVHLLLRQCRASQGLLGGTAGSKAA